MNTISWLNGAWVCLLILNFLSGFILVTYYLCSLFLKQVLNDSLRSCTNEWEKSYFQHFIKLDSGQYKKNFKLYYHSSRQDIYIFFMTFISNASMFDVFEDRWRNLKIRLSPKYSVNNHLRLHGFILSRISLFNKSLF